MNDETLFPRHYMLDELDLNLELDVDNKDKQFTVKINGRPFHDLPDETQIISTQNASLVSGEKGENSNNLSGTIEFNQVSILKGCSMVWSN